MDSPSTVRPEAYALLAVPALWALLCLCGCATGTGVSVSGYLSPSHSLPSGGAVVVETAADAPNPLLSELIGTKSGQLLVDRGYRIASSAAEADLALRAEYAMSARSVMISRPSTIGYGPAHHVVVTGTGEAVAVPTGHEAVIYTSDTHTVYDCKLSLRLSSAVDRSKVCWVGEAVTESEDPDPRQTLDALITAAFRYFGQDTGRSKQLEIRADDPDVKRLSGSVV